MSYLAQEDLVQERQIEVQKLCIPFTITANATPASVVAACDEPGFMFLATQGDNNISAVLTADGDAASFAARVDNNGTFSILLDINEQIEKVQSAQVIRRNSYDADLAKLANTDGISDNGDKICLDIDAGTSFGSTPAITVTDLTGQNLGGMTLSPGIYNYDTSAQLTGTLILDGGGDANAQWIFQIGSTLTTASAAVVSLINGASADNVAWAVGTSATLGTTTDFAGNIFAATSNTLNTGATVDGRVYSLAGAVTLDTNDVTASPGVFGSLIVELMGAQASFAVLGASTITNTGATVVNGDLALHPGTSVTGFPPGIVNGTQHVANSTALDVKNLATAAYIDLQARTSSPGSVGASIDACLLVEYIRVRP